MRIQIRKGVHATILDLEGRLTAGQGAACLREGVDDLLKQGVVNIIVDMQRVDVVDCAGVGQLVAAYCNALQEGGNLRLAHAHQRLVGLLRLFRLQAHLQVLDSDPPADRRLPALNRKGAPKISSNRSVSDIVTVKAPIHRRCEMSGMISHYRIARKIGEGGMGVVYEAQDARLDRTVALKFLNDSAIGGVEQRERLFLEAKAAAALNHPNVCTIYEVCEAGGQMCIVMEFVEGESLRRKIKRSPLKLEEAVELSMGIARGLGAVHAKNIVHRDIKSANIMVLPDGRPKIMDFGLAFPGDRPLTALTPPSHGTPAYMSPEQARDEPATARTDMWAFGVVLYEMFSGRLPFHGRDERELRLSILNDAPEPLSFLRGGLPPSLDTIVDKALAKESAERYQDVEELMLDLDALRNHLHGVLRTSPIAGSSRGDPAGWRAASSL